MIYPHHLQLVIKFFNDLLISFVQKVLVFFGNKGLHVINLLIDVVEVLSLYAHDHLFEVLKRTHVQLDESTVERRAVELRVVLDSVEAV